MIDAETRIDLDDLREFAEVDIDADAPRYRKPLERDARKLATKYSGECDVILLGSVATGKYVGVLLEILCERLGFPSDFVGRGDMSRGGLLLRSAAAGTELDYVPVGGSARRGARPPRLARRT